ncbi:MAG TPA: hypothetical protein VHM91_11485, partial [Verrucomicrobiales bacterium]|nr:hypothetical protein [Verrucomicrobiales bacterium]
MKKDPPPDAAKPSSVERHRGFPRLRKWLKRGLLTLLVLIVLLAVFHRPILRFALDKGGKYVAKKQGMELNWDVDGSVTGGIDAKEVTITPNDKGPVQSLKVKRLTADYDLWRLMKKGPGKFVDRVILSDVDVVLDKAKFPPPDPDKPKEEPPP